MPHYWLIRITYIRVFVIDLRFILRTHVCEFYVYTSTRYWYTIYATYARMRITWLRMIWWSNTYRIDYQVRNKIPIDTLGYDKTCIYRENPWTSDRAVFPLATRITSSEKPAVGRQCPECYFSKFLHSAAKILRTYRDCRSYIYFEQLDPEILSAASSILCPLYIQRSGFDPIFYVSILHSSATHLGTYTYVLLIVRIECGGLDPILFLFCTLLRHIYARIRAYELGQPKSG